jgi:hypothetical protein
MLLVDGDLHEQLVGHLLDQLGLAGPDDLGRAGRRGRVERVAAADLLRPPQLRRIAMRQRGPLDRPVGLDELDEAPVGQLRDDEPDDQVGGLLEAERGRQQVAGAGHERVAPVRLGQRLLGPPALGRLDRGDPDVLAKGEVGHVGNVRPRHGARQARGISTPGQPRRLDVADRLMIAGPTAVDGDGGRGRSARGRPACGSARPAREILTRQPPAVRPVHPQPTRAPRRGVDHRPFMPEPVEERVWVRQRNG